MNITVIGAGYVGLVTSACFAELGNLVTCIDVDTLKISKLKNGTMPIYEPGLEDLVVKNIAAERLHFVSSWHDVSTIPDVIFIAVGTPSDHEGEADIQYVLQAAKEIGRFLTRYCVIVDKSTVPVGMAHQVEEIIANELSVRKINIPFDVVSNPEFLREGAAIEDFMRPDRIIIGLNSNDAKHIMSSLYLPIMRSQERIYFMKVKDAEMTKYAANAMLATRISFMNEMALLCEKMGADIENVRIGIGSDSRIGPAFLNAGCGYGGSCFPKDVKALIKMAEKHDIESIVLHAVEKRNKLQKQVLARKVITKFGNNLDGVILAIWGLSFKPGTDDMREASSLVLLQEIIERGAKVQAYDPVAMTVAKSIVPSEWIENGQLMFTDHQYEALNAVDALLLVTEWQPFCYPDVAAMKSLMRQMIVFDGRNQFDPEAMRASGFEYHAIGRSPAVVNKVALPAFSI